MSEMELFKSIWIGKKFVSIGDTKKIGNMMQFKQVGGVLRQWTPVLANADDIPFQERNLWIPKIGDAGIPVKVFMADLMLDPYYPMTTSQQDVAIAHLKRENDALTRELEEMKRMLIDVTGEDNYKKRLKQDLDRYRAIHGYGSGYGGYGFQGQSFSPTPSTSFEDQPQQQF